MHQRLAEISEYLAQQRRAVLDAASAVPSDRWQEQPAPDRWSVSQILEHLHMVERSATGALAKRIAAARDEGVAAEMETTSLLGALDATAVSDRSRTLVAPERATPTTNPDRATVERQLAESRAALEAALQSADGLALGTVRMPHPRLGDLDVYQWFLFIGVHERRHREQIEEVSAQMASRS